MQKHGRRVAVIDIGTNTILLLVAEHAPGDALVLEPVHDASRFGRLGQGLDRTGILDPQAIERTLAVLRDYRATIDELDVDAVGVVGTQALREAGNASELSGPAADILGIPIEVIAGEREARLVYRAVAESFPELAGQPFVVADVGGGSTEIIVAELSAEASAGASADASAETSGVSSFTSVPIGSVRLHERHLHSDPPAPAEVRALIEDVDAVLAPLELPTGVPLVATAGTATTLGAVERKLRVYAPQEIHGMALPREVVERQLARYLELTVAERRQLPGLQPERADVIAAGVTIVARLMRRLDADVIRISDRGVRWGLAYELATSG